MANITTDNIKAIVQSVIASATRHKPNLSVTDPDDPRYVVGADKVARQADVTKMGKRLTTLGQYEAETNQIANNARNTANTAQNTANSASSTATTANNTANSALNTAHTAKTTAETAKTTAESAKTTAETAKTTAETAKTTAESAKTTAETAKTTAESALPKSGGTISGEVQSDNNLWALQEGGRVRCTRIDMCTDIKTPFGTLAFVPQKNAETVCWVGRDSETDVNAPSTLWLIANGSKKMVLKGMNVLKMRSANASFWDIYVDDDGHLLIADESGGEVHKYVTPAKLEEAMETVGDTMTLSSTTPGSNKRFRLTVDDEGTIKAEEVTA